MAILWGLALTDWLSSLYARNILFISTLFLSQKNFSPYGRNLSFCDWNSCFAMFFFWLGLFGTLTRILSSDTFLWNSFPLIIGWSMTIKVFLLKNMKKCVILSQNFLWDFNISWKDSSQGLSRPGITYRLCIASMHWAKLGGHMDIYNLIDNCL